jgi:predicted nucleotidyltransferase
VKRRAKNMDSVVAKAFKDCHETAEGCYNLFGFAVEDYLYRYEKTREEVSDECVFGAILDNRDDMENILNIAKLVERSGARMLVFDVSELEEEFTKTLCQRIDAETEFEEIPDVYGDRVVFAR